MKLSGGLVVVSIGDVQKRDIDLIIYRFDIELEKNIRFDQPFCRAPPCQTESAVLIETLDKREPLQLEGTFHAPGNFILVGILIRKESAIL